MDESQESPVGVLEDAQRSLLEANWQRLLGFRGALASAAAGRKLNSVMVTSSSPGEGKTLTALSIAHTLSVLGPSRVLLLDCNPVNPSIHSLFNLPGSPGLADYVRAKSSVTPKVHATEFQKLSVMSLGSAETDAFDVLALPEFEKKFAKLSERFDVVVLDTSSALTSSEPFILAPLVDAVVLVIRCGLTRWETVQRSVAAIETTGNKIMGCVLNRRRFPVPELFYR